jgi:ribulose 1,5-bisphosphate synthetase/thiazole synthase
MTFGREKLDADVLIVGAGPAGLPFWSEGVVSSKEAWG